jgi:hypothetical protein
MGMYDYIKCEHPLPDGFDPSKIQWQTKDTYEQYLETYTISADGRLLYDAGHYESVPKAERPYPDAPEGSLTALAGSMRRVVDTPAVPQDFHGDIYFYGTEGDFNAPEGYVWREYRARFSEGKLLRIDLIECALRGVKQQSSTGGGSA